ncbi:MAG: tetratricopeptide repeat protein [Ignavibacteriae bacterium]|nr:tetratricopeptide repeat protein [Ignavibacteriota bacterium]
MNEVIGLDRLLAPTLYSVLFISFFSLILGAMNGNVFKYSIIFGICLIALYCFGYFYPVSLTWGFHFLGLLPNYFFVMYLFGSVLYLLFIFTKTGEHFVVKSARFMERRPWKFLSLVTGVFLVATVLFKVKAPLLGDGFFLVRNFSEAFRGISPLDLRNEPLATYYYYGFTLVFGTSTFEGFLRAFWIAGGVSGIAFLVCSFFIVRNLLVDATTQLITFLFVCTASYMQLFFGYVESYSIVLTVISLYLLCSILYLKQKVQFIWLALCFFLACVLHYLSVLLLPSLFYLMVHEWKERGIKQILVGTLLIATGVSIILLLAEFSIENLHAYVPHKHYLTVEESTEVFEAYSQAYTLFSMYHLTDWFNLFILLCPAPLFIIGLSLFKWKTIAWKSSVIVFLLFLIVPFILFTFIAKYDLGAAKDWDIAATFFPPIVLFACFIFFHAEIVESKKIALILLGISVLNSTMWFTLNARTDSAIARVKVLMDPRNVSHLGHYATSLHLAMYYHQTGNHSPAIDIWKEFSKKYPLDRRGYLNILQNINTVNNHDYKEMKEVYESWVRIDSASRQTIEGFSKFCIEAGNYYFEHDQPAQAKVFYHRATELTPQFARAFNNLGSVYAVQESTAHAITYFLRAIELDSAYADAYYNLGNAYYDSHEKALAKKYYEKAAHLGNSFAQESLKESQ